MKRVTVSNQFLSVSPLFLAALSEPTQEERMDALRSFLTEFKAFSLDELGNVSYDNSIEFDPELERVKRQIRRDSSDAIIHSNAVEARYNGTQGKHFHKAIEIGSLALETIESGERKGVISDGGLVTRFSEKQRNAKAAHLNQKLMTSCSGDSSNAQDEGSLTQGATELMANRNNLVKIWHRYRGVVHFGMAMSASETRSVSLIKVFAEAERIRLVFASSKARNSSTYYVPAQEQISFVYQQ